MLPENCAQNRHTIMTLLRLLNLGFAFGNGSNRWPCNTLLWEIAGFDWRIHARKHPRILNMVWRTTNLSVLWAYGLLISQWYKHRMLLVKVAFASSETFQNEAVTVTLVFWVETFRQRWEIDLGLGLFLHKFVQTPSKTLEIFSGASPLNPANAS